jgi:Fe-S-cluster containining protein
MKPRKPFPIPVRTRTAYSCLQCPGYCCSYAEIEITRRDIERLARYFHLEFHEAEARFTKSDARKEIRMLRHKKDHVFASTCMFFDQEKRRCTVYEVRPGVCRKYPDAPRCGYYDFLAFEREQQGDPEFIALT